MDKNLRPVRNAAVNGDTGFVTRRGHPADLRLTQPSDRDTDESGKASASLYVTWRFNPCGPDLLSPEFNNPDDADVAVAITWRHRHAIL